MAWLLYLKSLNIEHPCGVTLLVAFLERFPSQDPPPPLCELFILSNPISKATLFNMRAYNNSPATGCVKTEWASHGQVTSPFNPKIMLHGQIFQYFGALVSPLPPQKKNSSDRTFCWFSFITQTMLCKEMSVLHKCST